MKRFKENLSLSLKDKTGEIKLENVTIEFDGVNYILSAESTEKRRLSILSKELNDNPTCFSDYIVNPSELKGENCKYDLSGTILLRIKVESTKCGAKYQWAISSFKQILQTDKEDGYLFYIVPIDKRRYVKELSDINLKFEYKHNTYYLSQNSNNVILLKTDKDNKYKNMIVALLSLYQGTAMEIRYKEEFKGGTKVISYLPIQYRFNELPAFTSDLDYLEHTALTNFEQYMTFSLNTADCYSEKTKADYVVKAIERYIASKYVDNQSKFVYLVSILETIAEKVEKIKTTEQITDKSGKEHSSPRNAYDIVSESLTKKNIDLSKLNDTIQEDVKLKDFVDLRNEILHRLPTEKIIDYLNYKYPMFYLEFAVCIVILHHLGFDNIKFRKGFELSIYKE